MEAAAIRFKGPLDESLLGLQDLFKAVLLKHATPVDDAGPMGDTDKYEPNCNLHFVFRVFCVTF